MTLLRTIVNQKVDSYQLFLLAFFVSIILAGCTVDRGVSGPSKLNFSDLEPINLRISEVEIKSNLQQNIDGNQEVELVNSLMNSITDWVAIRLKLVGIQTADRLVVSINNLKAVKTDLILDKSFSALFQAQQSHSYFFKMSVSLEVLGQSGEQRAASKIEITRTATTPEGLTINERERLLVEVQKKIMSEFDKIMVFNISEYFFNWLEE